MSKKKIIFGNEKFDKKYLVKSHNSELTKKLFTNDIIDDFIDLNIYSLAYTTDLKMHTSNLISVISRTIDDKLIIKNLINFHFKIIDNLKELKIVES